jgi:hypothetical protein
VAKSILELGKKQHDAEKKLNDGKIFFLHRSKIFCVKKK